MSTAVPFRDVYGIDPSSQKPIEEMYAPGLGDIMATTQMRHAKLWFAGKGKNWTLAKYELEEIKEGFEDVAKFHPVFKGNALSEMLDKLMAKPIVEVGKAIESKDDLKFRRAFESLTSACNACHQTTRHGFIVIKMPTIPPVSNQEFSRER